MNALKQCIRSHIAIDDRSLNEITHQFKPTAFAKGEYFLKAGSLAREMAFIQSGYLRMYDIANGKEITLWIAGENRFITSLSSFVFQSENHWNIQCITDSSLLVLSRDAHFELCKQQPKWLEFDNLLLANSFRLLEQSMFDQLHTTARQRLDTLMKEQPELFNHVPLQYIASMIGITPESLSRLLKELASTS